MMVAQQLIDRCCKGFVNLALLKGYRLAFESSSDHISTHISYAVAIAEAIGLILNAPSPVSEPKKPASNATDKKDFFTTGLQLSIKG